MNSDIKFLVVDDEPSVLASFERIFRLHGGTIKTAPNAITALQILKNETFHIVISDMRMPDMDGSELFQILKHKYPLIRRILLTGYSDQASTVRSINEGNINAYVEKPWEQNDLIRIVEQQYALYKKEQNLHSNSNKALKIIKLGEKLQREAEFYKTEFNKYKSLSNLSRQELQRDHEAIITLFKQIIRIQNPETSGQIQVMTEYFPLLVKSFDLDEFQKEVLINAINLFPIGKLFQSETSSNDPYSFKQAEFMLASVTNLSSVGILLSLIQNSFDGSGDKVTRDYDLPIEARIFNVLFWFSHYLIRQPDANVAISLIANTGYEYLDPEIVTSLKEIIEKQFPHVPAKYLCAKIEKLRPGMIVAEDIYSEGGVLLLSRNTQLTKSLIDTLWSYTWSVHDQFEVAVLDKEDDDF